MKIFSSKLVKLMAVAIIAFQWNNAVSQTSNNQPIIDDDNEIRTTVPKMPEFPGGESALRKYFDDNLRYSAKVNIKGKVWVQFVIGKDGKVESGSVKVVNDIDPELTKEIINITQNMPQWSPGIRYESKNGNVEKILTRVSKNIPIEVVQLEGEEIFFIVENMPKFPGGDIALRKYIDENVHYPESAKSKKIEGKVWVQFVIGKDGEVEPGSIKVVKSANPLLDAESIRVVKSMPRWEPGTQAGKPMRVSYTVPISFRTDN